MSNIDSDRDDSVATASAAESAHDGQGPVQPERSAPRTRRNRGRRAVIGLIVGGSLVFAMQWMATDTDHQNANMGSLLVGFVTVLYVLLQLQLLAAAKGRRLVVPVCFLAAIATLAATFRFDGFSGEMLPQFRQRWATAGKLPSLSGDPNLLPTDLDPQQATAEVGSLGFLGSLRTAVIDRRSFAVPSSNEEITVLWDQAIGEGWSSFAVSGDKAVTLEQRENLECVTCYRLADGQMQWIQQHEARHQNALGGVGPRSTPTIDGDRVYAQGATGMIWCLDLQTGETIWTCDLIEQVGLPDWDQAASEGLVSWGRAGSPLLVDLSPDPELNGDQVDSPDEPAAVAKLCIVPFGGPEAIAESGRGLIAFDADTGRIVWTAGKDQISFASPNLMTFAGELQIVAVNEKTVSGHRIDDGQQLWSIPWPGRSNGDANCASAVPAGKNRFLVGKGYGGGSALIEVRRSPKGWTAEPIWESTRVLKTKFTHACVVGEIAYAVSNGSLEAVEIETGDRIWTQPRRSRFQQGQIIVAEDVIVAQAESGEVALAAVDPNEYREWLRIPAMTSKTWNVPTVAGRHLLVRNDRQAICFLLPPRP